MVTARERFTRKETQLPAIRRTQRAVAEREAQYRKELAEYNKKVAEQKARERAAEVLRQQQKPVYIHPKGYPERILVGYAASKEQAQRLRVAALKSGYLKELERGGTFRPYEDYTKGVVETIRPEQGYLVGDVRVLDQKITTGELAPPKREVVSVTEVRSLKDNTFLKRDVIAPSGTIISARPSGVPPTLREGERLIPLKVFEIELCEITFPEEY